MATLKELFGSGDKRQALIDDACGVLDQEVADKSGLSGIAIKTAFGVIKNVKPGFVPEVVDALLDDFLDALEPVRTEAEEQGAEVGSYLESQGDRAAEALLTITDERAKSAQRPVVKKTYQKLRPTAKKHVVAAMPRLGALLSRHVK